MRQKAGRRRLTNWLATALGQANRCVTQASRGPLAPSTESQADSPSDGVHNLSQTISCAKASVSMGQSHKSRLSINGGVPAAARRVIVINVWLGTRVKRVRLGPRFELLGRWQLPVAVWGEGVPSVPRLLSEGSSGQVCDSVQGCKLSFGIDMAVS